MKISYDLSDPLTLAMAPPANETLEERRIREEKEERALEVSRRIDAEIKAAKIAMKKKRKTIKVLVLGQSLSGKSTTIKNFQMTYAQKSWAEERASWRAVVLLNLVRSVNTIVDLVMEEVDIASGKYTDDDDDEASYGGPSTPISLTEEHKSISLRLAPLRQIEKDLRSLLGSGSSEPDEKPEKYSASRREPKSTFHEFALRSSSGWKSVLDHIRNPSEGKDQELQRVACHVVVSCKEYIKWLWNDSTVQKILRRRQIRLEDTPGFFLNDIDRIVTMDYEPSDEDVVRARLRTTGVQEYHFTLDRGGTSAFYRGSEAYEPGMPVPIGPSAALEWLMYDVAGTRTQRAAWIPYFKDITAIIFLAPLSAFNERLAEDPGINRLDDTLALWKTICASELLKSVQIILFLNKTDILKRKIDAGVRVRDHLSEFGDRKNDFLTVSSWFRKYFAKVYKDVSPPGRALNAHFTSVVDTKMTAQTLAAVQAVILRNDIADAGLL